VHPFGQNPEAWDSWSGPDDDGVPTTWLAEEVVDAELFLARLVVDELVRDRQIRAGHVVVTVQNGVVILEGQVDDPQTQAAAARRAWAIPGVFDVSNRLTVGRCDAL
jgi:hypothetical protein